MKRRYANRGVPSARLFLEVVEKYFVWPERRQQYNSLDTPLTRTPSLRSSDHKQTISVSLEEEKEGTERLREFIELLRHKAEEENDGAAQCVLGKMYEEGLVTGKSEGETAVAYYKKAAVQEGHHVGLGLLADAYDKGK